MRASVILLCATGIVGGCTTNTTSTEEDLTSKSTLGLCRILSAHSDQEYRQRAAHLLVRRSASVEKCQKLISSDNTIAASIAVAGAATAADVAAHNGYGGYAPPAYGVAWDQFYNEYHQLIWRCRDRATGRFVYDYSCSGLPMHDGTWPGWSA